MAEGTKDVSTDLQARTDQNPLDQLLIVNATTKEVQGISLGDLGDQVGGASPVITNDSIYL